jgi:hypothetical protein
MKKEGQKMEDRIFKIDDLGKIFPTKPSMTLRDWHSKNFFGSKPKSRQRNYLLDFDEVLQTAVFIAFYDMGFTSRFASRLAKRVSREDWFSIREENQIFFALHDFERGTKSQTLVNGSELILEPGMEGCMILNGRQILDKVIDKIDRNFL